MLKRTASTDRSVSPPPVRRKLGSTTTSKAVNNFFTPASKKEPDQLVWSILHGSVIRGQFKKPTDHFASLSRPIKVASFDLDDTVISPKTGNRYERHATSWKWWNRAVPSQLRQLHLDGYLVVILSNQGAISLKDDKKSLQKETLSSRNFKDQATSVLTQLDFPASIYAATGNDVYRKPRTGMWGQLKLDYGLEPNDIDMEGSFYIGDAAGREQTDKRRKDHAVSDRYLASNIGIPFQTPEEFFIGQATEPYVHAFEPSKIL
ncbi:DNA kinase/phosphatase Pnk1, partial [Elasticomyces elasticus]